MRNVNFAILDQCLISGTNFFLSLILARVFSPHEFGLYVFAFTTLVLSTGFMNSAICVPLSVLGTSTSPSEWQKYLSTSFLLVLSVSMILGLIFLALYLLLKGSGFASNANILGLLGAITFFFLTQEYIRRALITKLKIQRAFIVDAVTYLSRLIVIVYFSNRTNFGINIVIIIFGLSSLMGIVSGLPFLSFHDKKLGGYIDLSVLGKIWDYGKWTLSEWVPFTIAGSLHIYIVAFVIGNEANGVIGACRNLIGPVSILMVGIMNFALPYYSRVYNSKGHDVFLKSLKSAFMLLLIFIISYLTLINIFAGKLLLLIFHKYETYTLVVFLFSLGALINYLFKPADIYFKVVLKPKVVFVSRSIAAIAIALACYPVIFHYGIKGAAFIEILSQTIMAFSLYTFMYRTKSNIISNETNK